MYTPTLFLLPSNIKYIKFSNKRGSSVPNQGKREHKDSLLKELMFSILSSSGYKPSF